MRFYLGVTDNNWYKYLSEIHPEDVNFWQPGGNSNFKILSPGAPFLFKLKSPLNAIGGVGFFSTHSLLPISIAWDAFGNRNGCGSYQEFSRMILGYRKDKSNLNPTIGCIILTDPIFFDQSDWIEIPSDWSKSIVQGKSYTTEDMNGKVLWERVEHLINKYLNNSPGEYGKSQLLLEEPLSPLYSSSVLQKVRLGQGAFRVMVTDAYSRRCAISGERTLPVLDAAHIKPYTDSGPHFISNSLLLRTDIHKLFDRGYLTITDNYIIEVSSRIKEEFQNGKEYYQYHGKSLQTLPLREIDRPDNKYIEWHNNHIYLR